MNTRYRTIAGALLVALALLAAPLALNSFLLFVATTFFITAVAAIGLNLVMGYAGLVSLGHAGFVAIGAYTTVLTMLRLDVPFLVTIPIAGLTSGVVGFLIGLPALRLSPLYLAVVTFSFGQVVYLLAQNTVSLTGGPTGIGIGTPTVGSIRLDRLNFYYMTLLVTALMLAAAWNITRSRPGRAFKAIRDGTVAAQMVGVNLTTYETAAFALSAVYAGVAGALLVGLTHYISPDSFVFGSSLLYVTMNVIGGMGSLAGSLLGAAVFTVLPELIRGFDEYRVLVASVLLLVFLLFLPLGMRGAIDAAAWRIARRRPELPAKDASRMASSAPRGASALVSPTETSSPEQANGLLVATDLSIAFGGLRALDKVSLTVEPRQIHALIGPNGSGKTTFINVVSGVYRARSGSVRFAGRDILQSRPHERAGLGLTRTFQNLELFRRMTVRENILAGLHTTVRTPMLASMVGAPSSFESERALGARADGLLRELGLWSYADRRSDTLSFGHQRMLELARALAADPRLVMLDEPGAGLTAQELDELAQTLLDLRARGRTAFLLVAHTMRLVMNVADVVTVLDYGTVIASGPPHDVVNDDKVLEAYLGRADAAAVGS